MTRGALEGLISFDLMSFLMQIALKALPVLNETEISTCISLTAGLLSGSDQKTARAAAGNKMLLTPAAVPRSHPDNRAFPDQHQAAGSNVVFVLLITRGGPIEKRIKSRSGPSVLQGPFNPPLNRPLTGYSRLISDVALLIITGRKTAGRRYNTLCHNFPPGLVERNGTDGMPEQNCRSRLIDNTSTFLVDVCGDGRKYDFVRPEQRFTSIR